MIMLSMVLSFKMAVFLMQVAMWMLYIRGMRQVQLMGDYIQPQYLQLYGNNIMYNISSIIYMNKFSFIFVIVCFCNWCYGQKTDSIDISNISVLSVPDTLEISEDGFCVNLGDNSSTISYFHRVF